MAGFPLTAVVSKFLNMSIDNLQVASWQLLQNKIDKLKAAAPKHGWNEAWGILCLFQIKLEGKLMKIELVFVD